MNNRLFDTAHNSSAQQRARIQTRAIHMDTLTECVASKVSSDFQAIAIGKLIAKTDTCEMAAVEVQS